MKKPKYIYLLFHNLFHGKDTGPVAFAHTKAESDLWCRRNRFHKKSGLYINEELEEYKTYERLDSIDTH